MSLAVVWDFPALTSFKEIPWPTSEKVAEAVYRFACRPNLPAGRHSIRAAGYEVPVRVDHTLGTVLVLHVYEAFPRSFRRPSR